MIRKVLFALALAFAAGIGAQAQNIQLHYDFGRQMYDKDQAERPNLTTTVEMFRPDKWGNTFFFIDMNYRTEGVQSAYWEVSREIRLGKSPFLVHVEFDGGLSNKFSYNNAYLAGITYAWNRKDFQGGFTITPMYKYLAKQNKPNSWQLTATWYYNFCGGVLSTSGFADVWGDRSFVDGKTNTVFLTEPQLWVNLNKIKGIDPKFNLSVGTEWEFSYNFAVAEKFTVNPTLAVKWTF